MTKTATAAHEAAFQDLNDLLKKYAGTLTALEILAVGANMIGKLVALQDQRSVTPQMAMEVVAQNIEMGNRQVLDELAKIGGTPN